jgi:hypothetical protein
MARSRTTSQAIGAPSATPAAARTAFDGVTPVVHSNTSVAAVGAHAATGIARSTRVARPRIGAASATRLPIAAPT